MNKYFIYLIASLIIVAYALNAKRNAEKEREVKFFGFDTKALVYDRKYNRGSITIKFNFNYKNVIYTNDTHTSDTDYYVGDTILVRILPKDPTGYCNVVKNLSRSPNSPK